MCNEHRKFEPALLVEPKLIDFDNKVRESLLHSRELLSAAFASASVVGVPLPHY
jgi:hypothetical protein